MCRQGGDAQQQRGCEPHETAAQHGESPSATQRPEPEPGQLCHERVEFVKVEAAGGGGSAHYANPSRLP